MQTKKPCSSASLGVKEFLNQSYKIEKRINSKIEQIKTLRILAEKVTSVFSDMPKNTTKNPHIMEETIAKLVDLETEVSEDLKNLVKIKEEITHFIKNVENKEFQMILELRYLCHKDWQQIADNLGYDLRYTFKIHGKALKFVDFLKEDTKRH